MKNLITYFVFSVFELVLFMVYSNCLVHSIMVVDYFGVIIWSIIFAIELNEFLNKHREFVKYHPNFTDRWLYSVI